MTIAALIPIISEGVAIICAIGGFIKYAKDNAAREATQNIRIDNLEKRAERNDTQFLALSTQLTNIQASLASIQTDLAWLKKESTK